LFGSRPRFLKDPIMGVSQKTNQPTSVILKLHQ
jgi:hypothetical protein